MSEALLNLVIILANLALLVDSLLGIVEKVLNMRNKEED